MNYIAKLERSRRIDPKTNCWLYTGSKDRAGYGLINFNDKTVRVHRLAYHLYKGFDLDSKELILHLNICPNKNCFNIEHLYQGNHSDNRRDVLDVRPDNKRTHCKHGHELTKKNSYYSRKGRDCL